MPIYMDRHDVSEEVDAAHVAMLHQEDLKVQDQFNCRGLTYWFDSQRKTAFCLIEAPNKEALQRMHDCAHGDVPHHIIEVDEQIVESFLGRIEDPKVRKVNGLAIIDDSAFRTIMVAGIQRLNLNKHNQERVQTVIRNHQKTINKVAEKYKGSIVQKSDEEYLVSFHSTTQAVLCAIEIQTTLCQSYNYCKNGDIYLKIGVHSGVPVTENGELFEDTIKKAERFCFYAAGQIVVSSEVRKLFEYDKGEWDQDLVRTLTPSDERFLDHLMNYTEQEWSKSSFNVANFGKNLGCSKSKLFRDITSLTGFSPNHFIKHYRLKKALDLLSRKEGNVSEIAYETGYSSPAYFSKCFHDTFGVLPSQYLR